MRYRLGVDVGGTFTDLALHNVDTDELEFAKTPSTPENQAAGVSNGVNLLIDRLGISPDEIEFFSHGTTVATNTLLERKGAKCALIVTRGFRDVLQIGRQDRPHLYDWRIQKPEPIVPRHLRFEVTERILYTGEVATPLDEGDLEDVIARLAGRGPGCGGRLPAALLRQSGARAGRGRGREGRPARPYGIAVMRGSTGVQGIRAHEHDDHQRLRGAGDGPLPEAPAGEHR